MIYDQQLKQAIAAAQSAGNLLRTEFNREGGPRGSGSHADIDNVAERAIYDQLSAAFPGYGFLCEEEHREPSNDPGKHLWIVDPNDGTSWYLKGYRGSAVSIALLRNGRMVLGVVYAYNYPNDDGDLIAWADGCGGIVRNGVLLPARIWSEALSVDVSVLHLPSASEKAEGNALVIAPARFRALPSIAYRLALVAAGDAEATVSINGPCSWDFAAGHALVQAAGGMLGDDDGKAINYLPTGQAQTVSCCYGGHAAIVRQLARCKWARVREGPSIEASARVIAKRGSVVTDAARLDRAQGCLMGQFAGDALGQLVEFMSAASIKQRYPEGLRLLTDGGTWNTIAGQPTDDSEMALLLARSMLSSGGYDQEAAARAYATWFNSGPFDIGSTTRQALSRPAAIQREDASAPLAETMLRRASRDSQANGSLMRISPLGLIGCSLPEEELARYARQDAQLTHPHIVCQDAGVVFTWAIAQAIRTGAPPSDLYAQACAWAEKHGLHKDVLATLHAAGTSKPKYLENSGWVRVALQNAFYQLLNAKTFEAGVTDTVAQGGDTDTNGAIAGALLGAAHGLRSIPMQWKERVLACRR